MSDPGWSPQQPRHGGQPHGYPPPWDQGQYRPPPPVASALLWVTAVLAAGTAVYWGVVGTVQLVAARNAWGDRMDWEPNPTLVYALRATTGAAGQLAALALAAGVVQLIRRSGNAAVITAAGGGLAVLPLLVNVANVASRQWKTGWAPNVLVIGTLLGLLVLVLALLPPVRGSLRRRLPPGLPGYQPAQRQPAPQQPPPGR